MKTTLLWSFYTWSFCIDAYSSEFFVLMHIHLSFCGIQRPSCLIVIALVQGSDFKSSLNQLVFAPALPELLWLPTVWRCPFIEIAFSTLDCSIVPTCGAWGSATAAKRGPLKQSWAGIQHSRDDEPLGVLMQMRNVRVNGFFFFLL